jgi:hypothetical protein
MVMSGVDLAPGIDDPNQGLGKIFFLKAHSPV